MKTSRRSLFVLGILTLALGVAGKGYFRQSQKNSLTGNPSSPNPQTKKPLAPAMEREEKSPELTINREERLESYLELLAEAGAKLPKVEAETNDLESEPEKIKIVDDDGLELVQVNFADGGKSYYPNNAQFDPTDGTFHDKEF